MNEHVWLAEHFEAERPHLRAVAYRAFACPLFSLTKPDQASISFACC